MLLNQVDICHCTGNASACIGSTQAEASRLGYEDASRAVCLVTLPWGSYMDQLLTLLSAASFPRTALLCIDSAGCREPDYMLERCPSWSRPAL